MNKWAFIICLAVLSASCNSILSSRPSGTLSEEQMIDMLVDIHLTEATLRIANDSLARLNDTTDLRLRFGHVFEKHDVNPDQFSASLDYYIEHIEELDKIYIEVINRLTALEASLQPKVKTPYVRSNKTGSIQNNAYKRNFWFKTLNKSEKPQDILYFDSIHYPAMYEVRNYPPSARR